MSGQLYYWVADWNLSRARAAGRLGGNVVDMLDATHDSVQHLFGLPVAVRVWAGYVTGSQDIRWTADDWTRAEAAGTREVVRIDQSNSDLPMLADLTLVKDDEPGASTNTTAVEVAKQRLAHGDDYTLYTFEANLAALEEAVNHAGLPHGKIIGYQYASPTSNPDTILPGTTLTLKSANVDLSVIHLDWLAHGRPTRKPKPHDTDSPSHKHSLARAFVHGGSGVVELDLDNMHWRRVSGDVTVEPRPWGD